jgi:dehydrogenase/reductase SDR family member 12
MTKLNDTLDWILDRSVVGGYTSLGYRARRLAGAAPLAPGQLAGREVVVTGANSGIGLATSLGFATAGARLHMVSRDRGRGEEARARVSERSGSDEVHLHLADIGDLDAIATLARELAEAGDGIDVLVHNAGVLAPERQKTAQGNELTFAVHVLGPYALTRALEPALRSRPPGRVIFVSSGGMYTRRLDTADPQLGSHDFDGPTFYAHAKRAQVVLAAELDRELGAPVAVNAMHPGWVETPGLSASLPRFNSVVRPLLRTPTEGADTILWLAAAERAVRESGRLWMDRRPRPAHRVPWTHGEPDEGARLVAYLDRLREENGGRPSAGKAASG